MYWFPVSTYNKNNQKNNTDDIFGPKHGVINWVCTAYKLNTKLEPVVDRDDTVERMVYRSRENVGNDRKDGR
jgi:rhamnose utilization protein RhaD (predicted bifunctional aldolase and dehydrogenase)